MNFNSVNIVVMCLVDLRTTWVVVLCTGHPQPPLSGTGVLWVSCRDPPVCHDVQGDIVTERQPLCVVLVLCCCWLLCRLLTAAAGVSVYEEHWHSLRGVRLSGSRCDSMSLQLPVTAELCSASLPCCIGSLGLCIHQDLCNCSLWNCNMYCRFSKPFMAWIFALFRLVLISVLSTFGCCSNLFSRSWWCLL